MDIRMPNLDGLEATRRLLAGNEAPTRVLILTTFELNEYVYEALRAGASGFLIKDAPAEQLIDAVRIVSAGDALLSPSVTRRVIEEFAPPALEALTTRVIEVLRLVAKGLSNPRSHSRPPLRGAATRSAPRRPTTAVRGSDR
jgi:DNA-binding NarL/FixJ family response regulator